MTNTLVNTIYNNAKRDHPNLTFGSSCYRWLVPTFSNRFGSFLECLVGTTIISSPVRFSKLGMISANGGFCNSGPVKATGDRDGEHRKLKLGLTELAEI